MRQMPPSVLPPMCAKRIADSDPVVTLALYGDRTPRELTEVADKSPPGAGDRRRRCQRSNSAVGASARSTCMLDINKLNGYSLTAQDVERAAQRKHRVARRTYHPRQSELGVRTMGRVENIDQFNSIIIKNANGVPIRLRDVGYAEDGMAERRTFAWFKEPAGRPAGREAPDGDEHREGGGRRHPEGGPAQ